MMIDILQKENMKEMNTVNNIILLIPKLEEYYLPCKSKIYLKDLTEKKYYYP